MFTLVVRSKVSASVKQLIWIDSRYINREAYGTDSELLDVELQFDLPAQAQSSSPRLYQNYPNPFGQRTKVGFELPERSPIEFQLMDARGKGLKSISGEYPAGYHEIVLDRGNLPSGLLYYTLIVNKHSPTRKMVLID